MNILEHCFLFVLKNISTPSSLNNLKYREIERLFLLNIYEAASTSISCNFANMHKAVSAGVKMS